MQVLKIRAQRETLILFEIYPFVSFRRDNAVIVTQFWHLNVKIGEEEISFIFAVAFIFDLFEYLSKVRIFSLQLLHLLLVSDTFLAFCFDEAKSFWYKFLEASSRGSLSAKFSLSKKVQYGYYAAAAQKIPG